MKMIFNKYSRYFLFREPYLEPILKVSSEGYWFNFTMPELFHLRFGGSR